MLDASPAAVPAPPSHPGIPYFRPLPWRYTGDRQARMNVRPSPLFQAVTIELSSFDGELELVSIPRELAVQLLCDISKSLALLEVAP